MKIIKNNYTKLYECERLTDVSKREKYGIVVLLKPKEAGEKLAQLEDIMEKYGIKSVEELDFMLDKTMLEWRNEIDANLKEGLIHDRDNWKKACELACEVATGNKQLECSQIKCDEECRGMHKCQHFENVREYFYQQAQKEGKK